MVSLVEDLRDAVNDTARVDALNRIASKHFELNQPEKAFNAAKDAHELALKSGYIHGEADSWENMAVYYDYKNQFSKAIEAFNASLHLHQHLEDSVQIARRLCSIGSIYRNVASFDTALFYFYRSRDIFQEVKDTLELANAFNLIGLVYVNWGDHEESLENFMRSMELSQDAGNFLGMSTTYCYIGMVYRKLDDYSRAEDYLNISLELNKKYGPTRNLVDIYTELGALYRDIGRNEEAIQMFEKSLDLARYYNNQRKVAEGLDNIGLVHNDQKEYGAALSFFDRALELRREMGINYGIMLSNINMVRTYISIMQERRPGRANEPAPRVPGQDKIFSLLDSSLEIAMAAGNVNDLIRTYETLVMAYAAFGLYDGAVGYQNALLHYRDSLDGINQNRSLAELQARFERDQQEQEILLLKSQNRVQETLMRKQRVERIIYTGSGISLVLLIIGLLSRMGYVSRARNELQHQNIQIEEEKRRAEHSEKVKEQFLSKMNHEIRIPMNTIMGSVNIILQQQHLDGQKKYLGAIRQSSENLLVIIDDILDLTQLEAGKINLEEVPFNIVSEVENIEQILKFKAEEKGIDLLVDLAGDLPGSVIGDPTRLSQILINLAGNAIKFTEKGTVRIRVKLLQKEENKARVYFEVADTGIGIPQERLDKIFMSFTQADSETTRKYGGTGLGLTISKQLVEMQHGNLGVESEPGKGSRFFFEIPYRVKASGTVVQGKQPEFRSDVMKDLKILVVEDDEFNVMVLHDTLSSALEEATLDVAIDGKEALEKWAARDYDVILMDIELPEMNGQEVARAIRRSGRMGNGVPIIAMTANALQKEMEACFNAGMNDFISKPFDQDDLIMKINRLMIKQQTV
jgi:signal transduction histidine kinase/CheY-like chemotaxis protein